MAQQLNARIEGILTPAQKVQKLLATRYRAMNDACHFTDEQMLKIVKIEDQRARIWPTSRRRK